MFLFLLLLLLTCPRNRTRKRKETKEKNNKYANPERYFFNKSYTQIDRYTSAHTHISLLCYFFNT
jgi:hypothetical protein